ncbi:MAG: DUF883 family protein [Holophagales bacterium]|jgi:ElaB/YqjD/DUF883 family membrane-anchored ribosome-binding protein|nr:DUF883 family protein [Holophagales bacterium]MBK9966716.1 DUF883 family protein [Holophagales bacterium]
MAETIDAAKMIDEKIDAAREGFGGRVKEKMGEVAEGVKNRAGALRDKIRDTDWDEVTDKATDYVRQNPGKSLAIALGVGFALGFLLRRRSDD